MKAKMVEKKLFYFDYMVSISKMNDIELSHCGYRNGTAPALLSILKDAIKEQDKIVKEHIKKYPD